MISERRFDRGAWLALGIAVGWTVLAALASLLALSYPSDGWTITRDRATGMPRLQNYFHPGPTPLRRGDSIVSIEGQTIGLNGWAPVGPGTRAGQTLRYTVDRDGQRLEVTVVLAAPGPAGLWPAVARRLEVPRDTVVAAVAFAVMLLAFLVRPGNLGARYLLLTYSYYFAVEWFGFMSSDLYAPAMPAWLIVLLGLEGGGWVWFFFPSITLVALSFPVVKRPLQRFPRLLPGLLYGLPALAMLLNFGPYLGVLDNDRAQALSMPIFLAVIALMVLTLAGALVHNWLTVREAVTRAQLSWVTLGLTLGLLVPFGWLLLSLALAGRFPSNDLMLWLLVLLPFSLAIAITRYRLWDIDVLIRRTLIYSLLSALLALAYFGLVIVLESLLRTFTGNSQNQFATVVSTLAIAALFTPLRARVQAFIDRRFFRQKYDAARTLAAFALSARDDVDLDDLTGRLVAVVNETLQPASVGLWLARASGALNVRIYGLGGVSTDAFGPTDQRISGSYGGSGRSSVDALPPPLTPLTPSTSSRTHLSAGTQSTPPPGGSSQ